MSVGSCVVVTCGCVSVCTKSVFGAAVLVVGACVAVIVGTFGTVAVLSVDGATPGFFLVRQAGARTAATIARLNANDFTALLMIPPSLPMISVALLRPIRILVLSVERQLQEVRAVDAHPVDLPHAAAVGLKGDPL